MRVRMTGLLMTACCMASYVQPVAADPAIWLQPMTYQEMRDMRDKAAETSASDRDGHPGARPAESKKTDRRDAKKGDRGDRRLRHIYLRCGPFPQSLKRLKAGDRPAGGTEKTPDTAAGSLIWLERPDQTIQGVELRQRRSVFRADYPADAGGWYRVFAYNDPGVKDHRRLHLFSFYTFTSHGDKAEVKERRPLARKGYFQGAPELELIRLYGDGEQRYSNYVGSKIRVRALFRGAPLAGANLTLTTQQGWRQAQTTDANGEAWFTLIKEDFHEDGVDRRKSELYLLRLAHDVAVGGQYQGTLYDSERYIATLSFRVFAAKDDWQSPRLAYLVSVFTIIGATVAIAIRRKRRKRP